MEGKRKHKKRPCRVCGKRYTLNPRLGYRQQTCRALECKRKWHTRKCAAWNRKNRVYFKEIYLRGRLEYFGGDPPAQGPPPCTSCCINAPPRRSHPGLCLKSASRCDMGQTAYNHWVYRATSREGCLRSDPRATCWNSKRNQTTTPVVDFKMLYQIPP